jgi:AcrR family transcriptional regulator
VPSAADNHTGDDRAADDCTAAAPGYARGRATRAEILDRAEAAFAEVGYRGASLREIAARCGISHPGLKHHFASKESLLLAVLERRDEAAQGVARAQGEGGAGELRRVPDVVAANAAKPHLVELFATLSSEATAPGHPAHHYFAQRYDRLAGALAEAYRAARDAGELQPDLDPVTAARELIALMDGLQIQWLYDRGTDMAGIIAAHLDRQLVTDPAG